MVGYLDHKKRPKEGTALSSFARRNMMISNLAIGRYLVEL